METDTQRSETDRAKGKEKKGSKERREKIQKGEEAEQKRR